MVLRDDMVGNAVTAYLGQDPQPTLDRLRKIADECSAPR